MRNQEKEKSATETMMPLIVAVLFSVIGFYVGRDSMNNSYNPRVPNNRDTIYYIDTGYAVRIYIDSTFEVDRENGNKPVQPR